jgi:hypothetical protein
LTVIDANCLGSIPPEHWTDEQRRYAQEIISGPRGGELSRSSERIDAARGNRHWQINLRATFARLC